MESHIRAGNLNVALEVPVSFWESEINFFPLDENILYLGIVMFSFLTCPSQLDPVWQHNTTEVFWMFIVGVVVLWLDDFFQTKLVLLALAQRVFVL